MPSWWGKGKEPKDPKEPKKQKNKDGMRLQIGSWKSRLSSWTDDERKNSFSPGYRSISDNSNSSRPLSPCTPCSDSTHRQPWPLPSSPLSPQHVADVGSRKNQSLPLPPPQGQKPRAGEACPTSASSSLSSSGSGDQCDVSHSDKHASSFMKSPISMKSGGANVDRPFSPCRSPRAILDAGDAFLPAVVQKSPSMSPAPSPRIQNMPHPLPSPPRGAPFPLSPTLSPSNRSATTTCWQKGKLIGNGTFGYVYVGFDSNNIGRMCAMKEVHIIGDNDQSKESAKQLGQEITLLSGLRHPNIVQYYGSESVEDKLYIYLEYVSGGSIHKLLQDYGPFKESVIRRYTRQILSGLSYLHSMGTVHRDIKGANILVDTNGVVKLADFGMAKHITAQSFPLSCKGSPYWMAPEILKSTNGYDLSVDIWSLGCTVIEMATGKPPWSDFEGVAVLFKIGNSKETPPIPPCLSEEGQQFLRLCLQRNPVDRPTASELMEHPFVLDSQECNTEHLSPYQARGLGMPEGYQSSPRYTPPRPSSTAAQFGFHPFVETKSNGSRDATRPDDLFNRRVRNSYGEIPYLASNIRSPAHHQRLVSCLDLKC